MYPSVGFLLRAILALWLALGATAAPAASAVQVVETLHQRLIEVMRDSARLGFEGRRERLAPVIAASYDLPFVTRLVLGGYWDGLDQGQRTLMISAFRSLTVATYAARFDGYSGQRFATLEQREGRRGRMLVRTALIEDDGARVRLDYLLRPLGGEWRIVNVLADGVSEIAIKRADYGRVMRDQGFDALVEQVARQTRSYRDER